MSKKKINSESEIITMIHLIRGEQVMLDRDLAELYDVETKYLKRQVRRNINRFPEDFMFELTKEEFENLRSQIGTSSWGGTRYTSMVFTEQGVAQLSSVINSDVAIKVNIQIIRLFTKMRKLLMSQKDLIVKVQQMEFNLASQRSEIKVIFELIKKLIEEKVMQEEQESRKKIGYKKDH